MSRKITFQGQPVEVSGHVLTVGHKAPDFSLVSGTLETVSLSQFAGKRKVLSVFPSVDTGVCAASVRTFNRLSGEMKDTDILCISADLPFAQGRFCGAEGLDNVQMLSTLRGGEFKDAYGVHIRGGALGELMTRAVFVLDRDNTVLWRQYVSEITEEPDYAGALAALK
ncbi:thiol peroxidase [Klebsiella aerogenes]|uniref:thiol peroxidase n=1 Tax=Klebsiella aerogenes TaxID=548 RepID=UPI002FFBC669